MIEEDGRTHLREISSDHSAILELAARQSLQRLPGTVRAFILDEDLTDAIGLPAATAGARDLHLDHFAVLFAFLLNVFADFYTHVLA